MTLFVPCPVYTCTGLVLDYAVVREYMIVVNFVIFCPENVLVAYIVLFLQADAMRSTYGYVSVLLGRICVCTASCAHPPVVALTYVMARTTALHRANNNEICTSYFKQQNDNIVHRLQAGRGISYQRSGVNSLQYSVSFVYISLISIR